MGSNHMGTVSECMLSVQLTSQSSALTYLTLMHDILKHLRVLDPLVQWVFHAIYMFHF